MMQDKKWNPSTNISTPSTPCDSLLLPVQIEIPVLTLNWSHFKPEFASKPNEDAEEHLLKQMI